MNLVLRYPCGEPVIVALSSVIGGAISGAVFVFSFLSLYYTLAGSCRAQFARGTISDDEAEIIASWDDE